MVISLKQFSEFDASLDGGRLDDGHRSLDGRIGDVGSK